MVKIKVDLDNNMANALSKVAKNSDCTVSELINKSITHYYDSNIYDLDKPINKVLINDIIRIYYVYAYMNPNIKFDTVIHNTYFEYLPIYIGKGKCGRKDQHLIHSHNSDLNEFIEDLKQQDKQPIIKIIADNLINKDALILEKTYIGELKKCGVLLFNISSPAYDITQQTSEITDLNLEQMKLNHIKYVLEKSRTLKEASEKLEMSERSLYRYVKAMNINFKEIKRKY